MQLLIILIIPLILAIGSFIFDKEISWKEFLIHLSIQVIIAGISLWILTSINLTYTETWNGRVTNKYSQQVHCRHSYSCNPHPCNCDKNGCSTCWDTCYRHPYDIDWIVEDNTKHSWTINTIDDQGLLTPPRWDIVNIGDPTSHSHTYEDYLRASSTTIYNKKEAKEYLIKFKKYLQPYPNKIYDYYKLNRLVLANTTLNSIDKLYLNENISKINGELGSIKKCNIIVVLTTDLPSEYSIAQIEHWNGIAKNDIAIFIGISNSKITWVSTFTLGKNLIVVKLRDDILEMETLNKEKLIDILKNDVKLFFTRTRMENFAYLAYEMEIPTYQLIIVIIIGIIISCGVGYFFHTDSTLD